MQVSQKHIYGVPDWVMKKYLRDLGSKEVAAGQMVGVGWTATIRKAKPQRIGSLEVGRIEVEFKGDEQAITTMLEQLHWKTLRGGG